MQLGLNHNLMHHDFQHSLIDDYTKFWSCHWVVQCLKQIKHLVQVCCGNKIHNITDTGYRFWLVTLETIKWRLKGIWFWKNIWFWKKRIDSDHWSIKEQAGNPLLSQGSRVWKDSDACLSALKGSLFPCKIIQIVEKFHTLLPQFDLNQIVCFFIRVVQVWSGLESNFAWYLNSIIPFLQHFSSSPQVGVFSPKKPAHIHFYNFPILCTLKHVLTTSNTLHPLGLYKRSYWQAHNSTPAYPPCWFPQTFFCSAHYHLKDKVWGAIYLGCWNLQFPYSSHVYTWQYVGTSTRWPLTLHLLACSFLHITLLFMFVRCQQAALWASTR